MLQIEASTSKITVNTSIIPDTTEDLQLAKTSSNNSSPSAQTNLLTTNQTSSTSSIELSAQTNSILDKSPEIVAQQADIDSFILNKNTTPTINTIAEKPQALTDKTDIITGDKAQQATDSNIPFESGLFQADNTDKTNLERRSRLRTSDQEKELITEATPKTETKLAEKKPDTISTTTLVDPTPEKSPATETKNSTNSEIPNSEPNPTHPKSENSPATETKNSTVSEICTCATNPVETKTEKSPAVEAKNPTISEIPKDEPKTENSPATETKNPTVSEIPNSATTPVKPKNRKFPSDRSQKLDCFRNSQFCDKFC
ncbi:MAG: hypothetical protein P2A85_08255 [Microcoleus anatoxicus]|uniref:hypothetical protein n=1 Tax=Microcoleus anatoxicus TaxID=2705319 RepID=UPI003671F2F3